MVAELDIDGVWCHSEATREIRCPADGSAVRAVSEAESPDPGERSVESEYDVDDVIAVSWGVATLATAESGRVLDTGRPNVVTPSTAVLLLATLRGGTAGRRGRPRPRRRSDRGAALVAHPDLDLVSCTGGSATGRSIMVAATGTVTKLALELGGRNPNGDPSFVTSGEPLVGKNKLSLTVVHPFALVSQGTSTVFPRRHRGISPATWPVSRLQRRSRMKVATPQLRLGLPGLVSLLLALLLAALALVFAPPAAKAADPVPAPSEPARVHPQVKSGDTRRSPAISTIEAQMLSLQKKAAHDTNRQNMDYRLTIRDFRPAPDKHETSWRRQFTYAFIIAGGVINHISASELSAVKREGAKYANKGGAPRPPQGSPTPLDPKKAPQKNPNPNCKGQTKYATHDGTAFPEWYYYDSCDTNILIRNYLWCAGIAGFAGVVAGVKKRADLVVASAIFILACGGMTYDLAVASQNSGGNGIIVKVGSADARSVLFQIDPQY